MGIKTSSARLLAYLKRTEQMDLRAVCMLGRQELCLTKGQIKVICRDYQDVLQGDFQQERFSEQFLQALGAEEIHSLDASDFEGADMICDLNQPIPAAYRNRFTCIIDGGTTEHVFSFDQAMENVMDMLHVGGIMLG